MKDNFENFLISQMEEIMNSFTSNLEEIIEEQNEFSETQKEDILKDLLDVVETISPYQGLLGPQIKDKINHIKHLLNTSNEIDEGEEHPLNTTPLSDIQEN
jgi:predicted house-cleaning noncanonical NTP pyrophosphatase (MazG superfamily)